MNLPKNVGKLDRTLRLSAGGILVLAAIVVPSTSLKLLMTIAGLLWLATGFLGVCPAYIPFKINTIRPDEEA